MVKGGCLSARLMDCIVIGWWCQMRILLWACLLIFTGHRLYGYETFDPVPDSQGVILKTNWQNMKTTMVRLNKFRYYPNVISFYKDQPYRLRLVNDDTQSHCFTAQQFFRSIAAYKLRTERGNEIKAVYFQSVELAAGESLELYFVPKKFGTFYFECRTKNHRQHDMSGLITVH